MKTMARVLVSVAMLAGCEMSHGTEANSSGSNWLRCKRLSECGVAEAVACSADGYCTDRDGERIEAQRSTLKPDDDAGLQTDVGCPWGVSEALAKIDVSLPDRVNCGDFSYAINPVGVQELLAAEACFDRGRRSGGRGVEFNINRCVDCSAPTHYVAAPDGQLYGVLLDRGSFSSDELRKVRVESCSALRLNADMTDFECVDSSELYSCDEPTSIARGQPTHQPIEPYKLSDPPAAPGVAKVPLHLYISNQSFDVPLVYVRARVGAVTTAQGDFPVNTQHTWIQFDLEVTPGSYELSAYGRDYTDSVGTTAASLSQTITVDAERWVVLNYWADANEDPKFTLTESETQVGFD